MIAGTGEKSVNLLFRRYFCASGSIVTDMQKVSSQATQLLSDLHYDGLDSTQLLDSHVILDFFFFFIREAPVVEFDAILNSKNQRILSNF
jgi:hypothetical protein